MKSFVSRSSTPASYSARMVLRSWFRFSKPSRMDGNDCATSLSFVISNHVSSGLSSDSHSCSIRTSCRNRFMFGLPCSPKHCCSDSPSLTQFSKRPEKSCTHARNKLRFATKVASSSKDRPMHLESPSKDVFKRSQRSPGSDRKSGA